MLFNVFIGRMHIRWSTGDVECSSFGVSFLLFVIFSFLEWFLVIDSPASFQSFSLRFLKNGRCTWVVGFWEAEPQPHPTPRNVECFFIKFYFSTVEVFMTSRFLVMWKLTCFQDGQDWGERLKEAAPPSPKFLGSKIRVFISWYCCRLFLSRITSPRLLWMKYLTDCIGNFLWTLCCLCCVTFDRKRAGKKWEENNAFYCTIRPKCYLKVVQICILVA